MIWFDSHVAFSQLEPKLSSMVDAAVHSSPQSPFLTLTTSNPVNQFDACGQFSVTQLLVLSCPPCIVRLLSPPPTLCD